MKAVGWFGAEYEKAHGSADFWKAKCEGLTDQINAADAHIRELEMRLEDCRLDAEGVVADALAVGCQELFNGDTR
jgi:hypothetical protein